MWDKILDLNNCYLQKDPSNTIRNSPKAFATKQHIPFFDPRQQKGVLRAFMIRTTSSEEIVVVVQFFGNKLQIKTIMDFLKYSFPEITSLQYVINQRQ